MSQYLNKTQLKALTKIGDIIIPGDKATPRFSQTDFLVHIDRMIKYIPSDDRSGLKLLLTLLNFTPKVLIRLLLILTDYNQKLPTLLGIPLRLIQIGIKGLIFTLYYSNLEDKEKSSERIYQAIEWETNIFTDEESMTTNSHPPKKNFENPTALEVQQIYADAHIANKHIKNLSIKQRLLYISRLKDIILKRKEDIISIIQKDTKKSRSDALISEIFGVLDYLHFLETDTYKALKDEKVKTPIALLGKRSRVYYESLGTMLVISPWNYPFYQAIVPLCTSFVCGNSTIYKPSEFTPLKGLVEELLVEAGFERDWIQIVYGEGETGKKLIDGKPQKIFFTGSVGTGKKIMQQASEYLIPVELELGGKDPAIIFSDANMERATSGVLWGALTNNGQSCTSVERVYVQDEVYNEFKELTLTKVRNIKQMIDTNGDSDIGFMTTKSQVSIIKDQLEDALSKGAIMLTGQEWNKETIEIPPIILENLNHDMKVVSKESFGPLICLFKFHDEAQVIELANDSDFGLSASVWSADKEVCDRVTRALDVGNVSVNNVMLTEGNPYLPFGGRKLSGIGYYKGISGLRAFSAQKSVLIDENSKKIEANWYPYTEKRYQLFSSMIQGLFGGTLKSFIKFLISGLRLEAYASKAKRH